MNKDVEPFLKYFLPKGQPLNGRTMRRVVTHLHLAFKGMETEEIYDVLMEQLIEAINYYDPLYTQKVKQVVEVVERELSEKQQFAVADVNRHVEFDCNRHMRLLCRRGFLESVPEGGKICGFRRSGIWPPPAEFFKSGVIGLAYFIPKWFRMYLQNWIEKRMRKPGRE